MKLLTYFIALSRLTGPTQVSQKRNFEVALLARDAE
jgi:hypothetical protein